MLDRFDPPHGRAHKTWIAWLWAEFGDAQRAYNGSPARPGSARESALLDRYHRATMRLSDAIGDASGGRDPVAELALDLIAGPAAGPAVVPLGGPGGVIG